MINVVDVFDLFGDVITLDTNLTVSAETFAKLFKDANQLSYAELIRIDDEKKYGYAPYIQKWKDDGLIE